MSGFNRRKKEEGVRRLLRRKTRCSYRNMKIGDRDYDSLGRWEVNTFLNLDKTDKIKYREEKFDCENFALRVMSNAQIYFVEKFNINPAFGMCWVSGKDGLHAINFYILKPHNIIVYIEPQSDDEYFLNGEKVKYILL